MDAEALNWMQNLDYAEGRNLQSYGKLIPEQVFVEPAALAPGNWADPMITTHLAETSNLKLFLFSSFNEVDDANFNDAVHDYDDADYEDDADDDGDDDGEDSMIRGYCRLSKL